MIVGYTLFFSWYYYYSFLICCYRVQVYIYIKYQGDPNVEEIVLKVKKLMIVVMVTTVTLLLLSSVFVILGRLNEPLK